MVRRTITARKFAKSNIYTNVTAMVRLMSHLTEIMSILQVARGYKVQKMHSNDRDAEENDTQKLTLIKFTSDRNVKPG